MFRVININELLVIYQLHCQILVAKIIVMIF